MTADPTAPKIDTTAPERIWAWRNIDPIGSSVGWNETAGAGKQEYIRADLAAAQTAAAVREMLEAALSRITPAARGWPDACTNAALAAAAREIMAIPLPDATALDRLLEAARQDERTAIAAYIGMSPSEVTDRQYHMEAIRTGKYRDDPLMQRGGMMEGGDG